MFWPREKCHPASQHRILIKYSNSTLSVESQFAMQQIKSWFIHTKIHELVIDIGDFMKWTTKRRMWQFSIPFCPLIHRHESLIFTQRQEIRLNIWSEEKSYERPKGSLTAAIGELWPIRAGNIFSWAREQLVYLLVLWTIAGSAKTRPVSANSGICRKLPADEPVIVSPNRQRDEMCSWCFRRLCIAMEGSSYSLKIPPHWMWEVKIWDQP